MKMIDYIICKIISIDELDNIIPVNPPTIVNNIMKPNDHKIEIFNFNFEP